MSSHSVVPIGGPKFVSPLNARTVDTSVSSSRLTLSSPVSPSGSSLSSSPSSTCRSPSSSVDGQEGSGSVGPSANMEAAVRYSQALHQHTQMMWEKERSSIERAKLESLHPGAESETTTTTRPSTTSRSTGTQLRGNKDSTNQGIGRRGSLGIEALFQRGRKRHSKSSSVA